ncbi:MAG TPA: DUF4013 domain-containing protein [Chthoniobacterales bacterium]|nr:DUF4013 domain-containing protein [Chthoniobacterales bacterium]
MNYTASISDFFKSPKWVMNLLLGGVCVLIPFVGLIVVLGWLVTGFWARQDENFESFPDFDFSHFGKYLERGLWPFLVTLVVSLLLVPVIWVLMIPAMLISGLVSGNDGTAGGCLALVSMILTMACVFLLVAAMMMLLTPLTIRAAITQDFAKSFDFRFAKQFVALVWKEMVLSSLFLVFAGIGLSLVGMILFCVGIYFANVVIYFSWTHLDKQLYLLYLSRGGEPVPLSPKLNDLSPAVSPC